MSIVNVLAFIIQMAFYVVVAGSSAWIAITFARYVKFMTGSEPAGTDQPLDVSVEEFVD